MITDYKGNPLHPSSKKTDVAQALAQGSVRWLSFRLNSVRIQRTRSADQDTDYLYFAVRVGKIVSISPTVSLGDVGDGIHPVNLELGPFYFTNPGDPVLVVAQVVNCHSAADAAKGALLSAGIEIFQWSGVAGPWGNLAIDLAQAFWPGIFEPGACDGYVALEYDPPNWAPAGEFWNISRGSGWGTEHDYLGTDSPGGCGRNSIYSLGFGFLAGADPANR